MSTNVSTALAPSQLHKDTSFTGAIAKTRNLTSRNKHSSMQHKKRLARWSAERAALTTGRKAWEVSFSPGKRDGNQRCGQLMMKWGQRNVNIHRLQSKSLAKKRHTCTTALATISKRAYFVPRTCKLSEQCTVAGFHGDARRAVACKWWKVNTNPHIVSINNQLVHLTAYLPISLVL